MGTVRMTDRSGNVVDMPRDQANAEIQNPAQNYVPSTGEEVSNQNNQNQFGTTGQQIIGAGEQALSGATLGFSKSLTKRAAEVFGGSEIGNQYQESERGRANQSPATSTAANLGGIFADPFSLFSGLSAAGGIAEKIASPLVENTIGSGISGTAAKLSTKLSTEGALFGSAQDIADQSYDDKPYSADATISSIAKGVGLFNLVGFPLHASIEATNFMLGKTKEFAKDYLDKATNASFDSSGEQISNVTRDQLKTTPVLENGNVGEKPSVSFSNNEDGTISHKEGKRNINIKMPNASGIDVSNPESMTKLGSYLGINDLGYRTGLVNNNQPLSDFLIGQKVSSDASDWLKNNYDILSNEDKVRLVNQEDMYDSLKNKGSLTEENKDLLKSIDQDRINAANRYSENVPEGVSPFNEGVSEKNARSKVKDYLGKSDYIKDSENTHFYNRAVLPEEMSSLRTFGEKTSISGESAGLTKQFNVPNDLRDSIGNDYNSVMGVIKDQYPNNLTKIGDVKTSFDHIAQGVAKDFDSATERLQNSVNSATSYAEQNGIKPTLTSKDIADYLDKKVASQYIDTATGNPNAGETSSYNAVKKLADEYRETRFTLDKYGERNYLPMDNRELWDARKNIDTKVKWADPDAQAISSANKNLRTFLDDHLVDQINKIPEGNGFAQEYIVAKKNWQVHNWANEIVGKAAEKAMNKAAKSGFDVGGAVMGGIFKGPTGFLIGGAKGYVSDFMSNYSGNIQTYMMNHLNNGMTDYLGKVDSAVGGFFSKAQKLAVPMAVRVISENDKKYIQNDFKKLQNELANREQFGNNFISMNNTLFNLAPKTGHDTLMTMYKAFDFLNQKIPQNPYAGITYKEDQWSPSAMEVSKYYRYRQAVESPNSILKQINDGYVTPEAIEVLHTVYPGTLSLLQEKMSQEAAGKKEIPIAKRAMIFKVFGVPMDSWQKPVLFAQMQQSANQGVQQTIASQNQNPVANAQKMNNDKLTETPGTRSQMTELGS